MMHRTVYLQDYQAAHFSVTQVYLTFEVIALDKVMVTNEMHLCRQSPGDCRLDGQELNLQEICIDSKTLTTDAYRIEPEALYLLNCPDEFDLRITTVLNPQKNTALSGLYASRKLLCTQCEAEGFRRITYYFDRPDVLSTFTCKIIANRQQFPYLLSNGNVLSQGEIDEHRHYVIWHDPFVKPCYLFALVAGDLVRLQDEYVTQSQRKIGLDIFVESGDQHLCAFALRAIHAAMRWDEEKFGREYDLERYMVVAIKDFNMGAMENKGLNIFNSKYVLADVNIATDDDIDGIESVIAHEYFHNWTGNRVTCRDWFQLSLKEGLTIYRDQCFSADMNDAVVERIQNVKNLRRVQFLEDQGPLAHPVQPKSYQEVNNFYTATVYEKGGEIVRMYEVLLGKQGFRKGMDLYFKRHDGQAVTIEDFLAAMADANARDLSQFKHWYDIPGTPVVSVQESIHAKKLKIVLQQQGTVPLYIPIRFAVYTRDKQRVNLPDLLILQQAQQTFEFDVPEDNVVVNYLQGFSAPIILQRTLSMQDKLNILELEQDGFALWDLKQTLLVTIVQQDGALHPRLLEMMKTWVMEQEYSPALLCELLRFPSYEECSLGLQEIDPVQLETRRLQLERELAQALMTCLPGLVPYLEETKGERAWRHLCAYYRTLVDADYGQQIFADFQDANNMTDRMASLNILVQSVGGDLAQQALDKFYQDWQHQELVMDKWFSLQARYFDLQKVQQLCQHPLFSWYNPNKVRAVLGAMVLNPWVFHAADGQGYAFLKDCVLKLDAINPQIAARMLIPLTRWRDLDSGRQALVLENLQILQQVKLSPNVAELLEKSLN